jgi:polysaccharide biosynthesis protein PslH
VRLLFYKSELAWPRVSGHDVFTFNTMRAMHRLGAQVGLVTLKAPTREALADLDLALLAPLANSAVAGNGSSSPLSGFQERYRSYWGLEPNHINQLAKLTQDFRADVVVGCGLDALPMLGGVKQAQRVWYAADEWVLHHATLLRFASPSSWSNLRDAAIKGLYERVFRRTVDRAWVVSKWDARAMRWIAGMRGVDVLRYGVDSEWYQPMDVPEETDSAVFWGRLDFGPNVQALCWFCRRIWPLIRARRPHARFTILGFHPTADVLALEGMPGITLRPNLDDIRPEIARHALVVLPFISGAGVKNKLLEAAAMGKAIICSPRALLGLGGDPPLVVANVADDWVRAATALWADEPGRCQLGRRLRFWVVEEHGWERPARTALDILARGDALH